MESESGMRPGISESDTIRSIEASIVGESGLDKEAEDGENCQRIHNELYKVS